MEKRIKGLSLPVMFVRYLVFSAIGCALLALALFIGLLTLQTAGFVYTARAGAEACSAAVPLLADQTTDTFDASAIPAPCRYALFSGPKPEAQLLATNMTERYLTAAQNAWRGGSGNLGYTQYHQMVTLQDGAACLLQYDYAVHYVNESFDRRLPDLQLCLLVLAALLMLLWLAMLTVHYTRLLRQDAQLLAAASARIAAQDISPAPAARARIREFCQALDTLDELRGQLAASLRSQWALEQQRTEQIAALTHDLKTPLTVISGNAELLLEDAMEPAARQSTEAILRSSLQAQEYLAHLRQIAQDTPAQDAMTFIDLPAFWGICGQLAQDLCRAKGIQCIFHPVPALRFCGQEQALQRALANLLDNAARFTPAGGCIELSVTAGPHGLIFAVQDSGLGFCPEALEKAGQLFYTSENARGSGDHQGLGLAFVREVAQRHGGELHCFNTEPGARVELSIGLIQ